MPKEKRLRIRRKDDVQEGYAKMNPKAVEYLGIKDIVEIVKVGGKKYRFKVITLEEVPENEVWCNADELRAKGIADKTIATCRAPLES
ncbi:MAG: hypothetical protein B6U69_00665 [Thermofilum sp. ex4484_15]|nr:MAG: hypothetical protein B6U69_00665 [Thermofilum sp. ex4484_15]